MISPDLLKSLKFVLAWEGGYVNNPADPGGATNKGVTKAVYDAWRDEHGQALRDVRKMTDDEMQAIYEARYWIPAHCPSLEHALNLVQLDTAINMGTGRATRFLQAAVGARVDGAFGPGTASCVANCDMGVAIVKYCDTREAFYRNLAVSRPAMKIFLKGWLNRLNALRRAAGLPGFEADVPVDFGDADYIAKVPDGDGDEFLPN